MAARRTAKQIAASRRNIIKAQRASADSRRGKKRSNKSGHHYGTGKVGRRQAKINKYGSRRHGISIAQQQRRDKRSRTRKTVVASAAGAAMVAAKIYQSDPEMRRSVNAAAKRAKSDANRVRGTYKVFRMAGGSRTTSARVAAKAAKRRR